MRPVIMAVLLVFLPTGAFSLTEHHITQQEELYASYDPLKTRPESDTLIFTDLGDSFLIRLTYKNGAFSFTPYVSSDSAFGYLDLFTKSLFSR